MTTSTAPAALGSAARLRPAIPQSARILGAQVLLWGGLIGLWQLAANRVPVVETITGSPVLVTRQLGLFVTDPLFWQDVGITVRSAAVGFAFGVSSACLSVALTWPFALVRRFIAPFLVIANAVPRIALAPLFILWFGIGTTSAAVFVASLIFLIVYLNVFSGLSSIDTVYVHNAKVLGAGRGWLARSVYVPAVTGWLMTSLRLAVVWAVLGAALAEYLGGSQGLGSYLTRGNILGDPALLVGAATVIAVISLLADRALAHVERRFTQWRLF
ncbi:ABC transporter permease [Blastococcus sp. PRF04-17]|uniref:ABC transporter permease n=1 Tax=Blastococcus sp. PRF04-17 TaxID=2933797 RepID=UPI001FF48E13|nr:ABC transporter permease [Blastococcus sp. PRF04-17]UOY03191.1 ABC transporter permease [Blastococcus sp. PRF04-17]